MRVIGIKEEAIEFYEGKYDAELSLWIIENSQLMPLQTKIMENRCHIIHCLKHIITELFGICPCGDFGKALLRNDFSKVVAAADDRNLLALKIYNLFLHNCVSFRKIEDYRKRRK